jgi:hypothetical protein
MFANTTCVHQNALPTMRGKDVYSLRLSANYFCVLGRDVAWAFWSLIRGGSPNKDGP